MPVVVAAKHKNIQFFAKLQSALQLQLEWLSIGKFPACPSLVTASLEKPDSCINALLEQNIKQPNANSCKVKLFSRVKCLSAVQKTISFACVIHLRARYLLARILAPH